MFSPSPVREERDELESEGPNEYHSIKLFNQKAYDH